MKIRRIFGRRYKIIIAIALIIIVYNGACPIFQKEILSEKKLYLQENFLTDEKLNFPNETSERELQSYIEYDKVYVKRVVDGDTIVVNNDGSEEKIRFIGIDCPESVNPDEKKNTEEGMNASNYTKERLSENTVLYLEYDKSKTDIYGRTLAYIWMTDPTYLSTQDKSVVCNYMYNAELIQLGLAEPKTYKPNTKYKDVFEQIKQEK